MVSNKHSCKHETFKVGFVFLKIQKIEKFKLKMKQISPSEDIGQQKVGSRSHNHFTNLQPMRMTNIRIWNCLYHNCVGIRHQQNSKSPGLFN